MATLNIPPRYRDAISKIQAFDETAFEELCAALKSQQPTSADRDVASKIAASIGGIPSADIEGLLESLIGLQIARSLADATLDQFSSDVVSELERSQKKSGTSSAERQAEFGRRIKALLSFDSLAIGAKSRDLQTDHERVYLNARVITDLRPVFRGSPEETPVGLLLHHMLRLTYFDRNDGERGSVYIAMDDDDLSNLKRLLERAEVKGTTLRKYLDDSGIKAMGRSRTP